MTEKNLTPEQKLDAIYDMLQKQESRQKRTTIFRTLKWLFLLGIVYFLTANPAFLQGVFTSFVGTTMDTIQPMMMEQIQSTLSGQTSSIQNNTMQKLQEILKQ